MNEEKFIIRAYGKSELAMLYFKNYTQESAMTRFREWLRVNPRLRHLIDRNRHFYTPKEVKMIVGEVGEPFSLEGLTEIDLR